MRKIKFKINEECNFLLELNKYQYKVLYGGRGGGKSTTIALALIVLSLKHKLKILCVREFQNSIRDSVHSVLVDAIQMLGLEDCFVVHNQTITSNRGSEFIFDGLARNVRSIKSKQGINICWVEEAETVSKASWMVLDPTIRKNNAEIWISFNPDQESDPIYKLFVENPPEEAKVLKIGWEDNPWISESLLKKKDYLYRVDPDAAAHVWGGETLAITKAQVLFGKVSIRSFEPESNWFGPYQGADWGFASHPTALVRCWIAERQENGLTIRDLYVEHEAYGIGVDFPNIPALFDKITDARKYVTRADNARPETISYMKQNGYPLMVKVEKGPGSVEDGIMHLRSFDKIIVHTRCVNTIQETRLYKYKEDQLTGDILPIIIKKHDDCIDSLRYALEPIMKQKKPDYENYKSVTKNRSTRSNRTRANFGGSAGGVL